jgi:hypothetical protein
LENYAKYCLETDLEPKLHQSRNQDRKKSLRFNNTVRNTVFDDKIVKKLQLKTVHIFLIKNCNLLPLGLHVQATKEAFGLQKRTSSTSTDNDPHRLDPKK